MSLGNLYRRLIVAAGAVALIVVKWLCKPVWRRPSPNRQEHAQERPPEEEALLTPEEVADAEASPTGVQAPEAACYEPAELSRPVDGAPVTPEDVVMEPAHTPGSEELQPLPVEEMIRPESASDLAGGAMPSSNAVPPSISEQPVAAGQLIEVRNPVDEEYLKSLLDQEFGPPKFAVRKPGPMVAPPPPEQLPPPNPADERSLQELLDQSFGPPKFAVPKPASKPSSTSAEATPDVSAAPLNDAATHSAPPEEEKVVVSSIDTAAEAPAPRRSESGSGGSRSQSAGMKRSAAVEEADAAREEVADAGAADEADAGGLRVLELTVTHGPAVGKRFVADDPSTEYKIGRLPDCSFQILDQEVSGRHAAVRWDGTDLSWKLHDVGSLNGTCLGGAAIAREYKVPGREVPLREGDCVTLGSVTRLTVALKPAARAAGAGAGAGAGAAKRHHADPKPLAAAAPSGRDPAPAASTSSVAASYEACAAAPPLSASFSSAAAAMSAWRQQGLPTPLALLDFPHLGARLCVHNRLGSDHKRMNQGCEDVPYWELPYEPYDRAGILCVFDGHHGSKAALQAREHVPAILRSKLLLRDGRQPPPLPLLQPQPPQQDEEEPGQQEQQGQQEGQGHQQEQGAQQEEQQQQRGQEQQQQGQQQLHQEQEELHPQQEGQHEQQQQEVEQQQQQQPPEQADSATAAAAGEQQQQPEGKDEPKVAAAAQGSVKKGKRKRGKKRAAGQPQTQPQPQPVATSSAMEAEVALEVVPSALPDVSAEADLAEVAADAPTTPSAAVRQAMQAAKAAAAAQGLGGAEAAEETEAAPQAAADAAMEVMEATEAAGPSATPEAKAAEGTAAVGEATPQEQQLLPPPPPAGQPLPPLLRGRDAASQKALLKDTFLAADKLMSMEEGCTATLVLLEAGERGGWWLQSANVGDSSALLVNFTRSCWCKLSEDHRIASSVSERQRLARRGHTVRNRLYGLNISRMLGDRFLKEEDLGFLAEPHVSPTAEVSPGDFAVLVVASDGLWDVVPEERAAKLLLQEAARLASAASSPAAAHHPAAASSASPSTSAPSVRPLPPLSCQTVADLLLSQALMQRSRDDITIVVLEMGPHLGAGGREGQGAAAR